MHLRVQKSLPPPPLCWGLGLGSELPVWILSPRTLHLLKILGCPWRRRLLNLQQALLAFCLGHENPSRTNPFP